MSPDLNTILKGLPSEERIRQGLLEYENGTRTIESCLVRIASPRLAKAGLIRRAIEPGLDAEIQLYQLLAEEGNGAYSRYNAILRELVSFERALDHRLKWLRANA